MLDIDPKDKICNECNEYIKDHWVAESDGLPSTKSTNLDSQYDNGKCDWCFKTGSDSDDDWDPLRVIKWQETNICFECFEHRIISDCLDLQKLTKQGLEPFTFDEQLTKWNFVYDEQLDQIKLSYDEMEFKQTILGIERYSEYKDNILDSWGKRHKRIKIKII